MNSEETTERPWWIYALVALGMIAAFFLLSNLKTRTSIPVRQTQADLARLQTGDWDVKVYFFLQYAGRQGLRQTQAARYLTEALKLYEEAARRPSPAAIRRAGVLGCEIRPKARCAAVGTLSRLDSPAVLRDLPPQDVRELRSETQMWREIYSGRLDPRKVDSYAARIRRLNLGPARSFALRQLYISAGRADLARLAIKEAEADAVSSLVPYGLLMMVLFLMGLAGLIFIGLFIRSRRRWLGGPETARAAIDLGGEGEAVPEGANPVAAEAVQPRILFEGFIAYILAAAALGIIAGAALAPYLKSLRPEQRLIYVVALEFGLSAASGIIGLAVLYSLLHRWGGRIEAIGLTLRDFRANVLWGVAGYCALLPLLAAASLIWTALSQRVLRGVETPVHPIVPMVLAGNQTVFLLIIVLGTMVAPFFEEIFFRGLLYGALRTRLNITAAVLISAAAFAIVHPFPAGFLPIFAIGSVFALLLEIRRSLVPSMIAHALNNGVTFLMIYLISVR